METDENKTVEQCIAEYEKQDELKSLRNLRANLESGIFVKISPELIVILMGKDFTD